MALVQNFSVTQSLAYTGQLTFTDSSTGSDSGLSTRRITITTAQGTTLVVSGTTTTYELWPLPLGTGITLDVLTQSTACNIKVDWMTGAVVTYTKTILYNFNLQGYLFLYNLTRSALSRPTTLQDTNYYDNKIKMIVNLDDSENAVSLGSDIVNAQNALDRATYLSLNESLFF